MPPRLSYALVQTGRRCTRALDEPTGEFLSIVQGCRFTSIWVLFDLFWFPVQDVIPQRLTEGMRMMRFKV